MTGPAGPARKDRFTALDTLALVRELRRIGRARVDKASDLAIGGLVLTLKGKDAGRTDLAIVPGRYAALLTEPPDRVEELSPFARELRRLLTGALLVEVPDPGGERYLELGFRRADVPEPLVLATELFGTGNVVVARGSRLVAVLHPRSWSKRTVRVGAEYVRPPGRPDPFSLSEAGIGRVLSDSRTDRVTTLSAKLGLGGPLAEEALARAELDPFASAPDGAEGSARRLHVALTTLVGELGETPRGSVYLQDGVLVDAEPYESLRWRNEPGVTVEARERFSDAAWAFFTTLPAAVDPVRAAAPDPRAEMDRQIRQQEEAIARLDDEARALSAEADAILARFPEVEAARAAFSGETGTDGRLELEVDGRTVRVYPDRPLRESAGVLYEEAKRTQAKLAGARAALEVTTARREAAPTPSEIAPVAPRSAAVERSRFWFQKFRWFVSTEGVLVVGGRDAASNDLVVRRYLRPADRYVHADLHGAPSVVIKHPAPPGPDPGEATLREAGQFGVAFSKAWRAGLASASAFWVLAEQVSKTPASGEFVARGAWVVHGTKHVMKDLPTELALGVVRYEGAELWCVGPPAAVRAHGEPRYLLTPGDERRRNDIEVELVRELGISRDLLQSLLPAGGIASRRA